MEISDECRALVMFYEGLRLSSYKDAVGIQTIGYGHTRGVTQGQCITSKQAADLLDADLREAGKIVEAAVHVPITQFQFDALTSFVFNVGPGGREKDGFVTLTNGKPSTMLSLLNKGDHLGASAQFGLWVHAGGKVLKGLVARRRAECFLFSGRDWRDA